MQREKAVLKKEHADFQCHKHRVLTSRSPSRHRNLPMDSVWAHALTGMGRASLFSWLRRISAQREVRGRNGFARCGAPPWPLWPRRTTLLELVAKRNAKRRNGIFVRNAGYSCVREGCPTPAGDLMATHDARGRSTSLPQANPPHSRAPAPARAKAPMNCTPRPNGWTERLCAILPPTTLRTTCLPYRRLPLPAAPCRRSSTMPQGRIDPAPLASRTANRYVYSRAHWG